MNKVVLMGRLTKDPELRYTTNNNTPVCRFTLAVDRRFVRQGEEGQADFLPIVAWSKLAEFCSNYLKKGTKVVMSGRIQTRSWDGEGGKKNYATEIIADDVEFAESKKASQQNSDEAQGFTGVASTSSSQSDGFFPIDSISDDELPF